MECVPLNRQERATVVRALNIGARQLFPGLLATIEEVARLVENQFGPRSFELDDLPSEVITAVACDRTYWMDLVLPNEPIAAHNSLVARMLIEYLSEYDRDPEEFRARLNEVIWPAVEAVCKSIDRANVRVLWDRMIESRVESRLCVDLLLNLALDFCGDSCRGVPVRFAEISLFNNVWKWPSPLPPSEAHAVRKVLELAKVTHSLPIETILSLEPAIGQFMLGAPGAEAGESSGTAPNNAARRAELFARANENVELLLMGSRDYLNKYLDALEEHERDYYRQVDHAAPGLDRRARRGRSVPDLADLRTMSSFLQSAPPLDRSMRGQAPPEWISAVEKWGHSIKSYLLHNDVFQALRQLLPKLFYVDRATFKSDVARRLVAQVERWLYYWTCRINRYGKCESPVEAREIASYMLLLDVVRAWHETRDAPWHVGLERARDLLNAEPATIWQPAALTPEQDATAALWMLPLWLLELRVLRRFGRGSLEWEEANRLAVERLGFLACRVDLADIWSNDPSLVLFILESIRQLAVARADLKTSGPWDTEMLRCARQILVRLEMIESADIRRAMMGFLHPVLSAIAAWHTATCLDPLEGLCLFEMARSRWLIDHLALGDRTLAVRPDDSACVCEYKDLLFGALNPKLSNDGVSLCQEMPDELWKQLLRECPDLGRLAAANWLSPAEVRRRVPSEAVVLAYEIEDYPADPPELRFVGPQDREGDCSWGCDSRLWMFLLKDGKCHAQICEFSGERLRSELTALR